MRKNKYIAYALCIAFVLVSSFSAINMVNAKPQIKAKKIVSVSTGVVTENRLPISMKVLYEDKVTRTVTLFPTIVELSEIPANDVRGNKYVVRYEKALEYQELQNAKEINFTVELLDSEKNPISSVQGKATVSHYTNYISSIKEYKIGDTITVDQKGFVGNVKNLPKGTAFILKMDDEQIKSLVSDESIWINMGYWNADHTSAYMYSSGVLGEDKSYQEFVVKPPGISYTTDLCFQIAAPFDHPIKLTIGYAATKIPPTGVSLPSKKEIVWGDSASLGAEVIVFPDSANYYATEWKSSNPAVATVTQTGKVQGVKPGTAVISYKAGELTAKCTVVVGKKSQEVSLVVPSKKISSKKLKKKKLSITLKAKNNIGKVTFKKLKGNKKIKVAANGKVTLNKGLKKGNYKVKLKMSVVGTDLYNSYISTETVKITVK